MPRLALWGLAAVMLAGACNDRRTSIDLVDYNRACAADNDCVMIATGPMCPCGSCANRGAINRGDFAKYEKDVKAIDCGEQEADCQPCPEFNGVVRCTGGVCEVLIPASDSGVD